MQNQTLQIGGFFHVIDQFFDLLPMPDTEPTLCHLVSLRCFYVAKLIKCRQWGVIMQIYGKLDKKKNDYVKYAFILKEKGELSTNELQYWVKNTFPFVDCSKNRISAIVCRKSIFITRQIGQKQKAHSYSGDIPISKRVKTQWLEKLSLKG